jgi:hypothetical protein
MPVLAAIAPLLSVMSLMQGAPSFTTIARGGTSAIEARREVVIRDEAAWQKLWREHDWNHPAPPIDFTRRTVVGLFAGTRATAGYAIEITALRADGKTLVVTYREESPSPGAMVAQVLTMPFHLVSVPAHQGPVRFERTGAAR